MFTSTPKQYVVTLKLTLQSNSNVPVFSAPSHASVKTASLKKGESVQVYPIPQSGFYYLVNGSVCTSFLCKELTYLYFSSDNVGRVIFSNCTMVPNGWLNQFGKKLFH